jgi:hypothetical protein
MIFAFAIAFFVVIPQRSGGICFSLLHLGLAVGFSPLNQA